ncbi:IS607 family element RNA-guided endonuclease TnpB [Nocardia fluminea]|uniref:IS607 family element RNA-guided endonuclease TnpB n=1 Tax=Nocardia fluminea TaxID=134984 RepID=UPI00365018B3
MAFQIPEGWTAQAYRFALDPTATQERAIRSHCGAARFAHNHMLALVKAVIDQRSAERSYGVPDNEMTPALGWSLAALRKTWNRRKDTVAPWWSANSKEAYNSGLNGLARGLDAWSASRKGARAGAAVGFPRFKPKHRVVDSVRFTTGAIRVDHDRHHVTLPVLGTIHTHESTRKLARRIEAGTARILAATVKYDGRRWYCAFAVIVEAKRMGYRARRSPHPVVGVDVGVKDLLVVAAPDGTEIERIPAPRPLAAAHRKLRRLQRRAARQRGRWDPATGTRQDPSMRWLRTQTRIARIHARVANIRRHELHTVTTGLVRNHDVVVVEDLNVAGMSRRGGAYKRGLNRAIGDGALGRIRTQLGYKTTWNHARLVTADRWFPSTQTCSRCQAKTKLALRDRTYYCRNGCPPIDRDTNAAINLARLGETTEHGGVSRTGTGSSPAASDSAGDGCGAIHKTFLTDSAGKAGGIEASTPHFHQLVDTRGLPLRKERLPEMNRHTELTQVTGRA